LIYHTVIASKYTNLVSGFFKRCKVICIPSSTCLFITLRINEHITVCLHKLGYFIYQGFIYSPILIAWVIAAPLYMLAGPSPLLEFLFNGQK